jgi:hypothetical protein
MGLKRSKKPTEQPPPPPVIEEEEEDLEELEEDPEGFVIKKSPWIMKIEGNNQDIPLTGVKFPMFTSGMIDRGELTIETINAPGNRLNQYFRAWLSSPRPRKMEIRAVDPVGAPIETWTLQATPAAMGFSDHNVREDDPWTTQVVFTVSEVKINF